MKWIRQRNILSFPYNWQRPPRTEEWAWQCCLESLPPDPFQEMVCFPWASLVDFQDRGREDLAGPLRRGLLDAPPRAALVRATVCQHIRGLSLLPWFQRLGITDLFWSHAPTGLPVAGGVRIHPFPLHPACCDGPVPRPSRPLARRRYRYSFIGSYQEGLYLTPVRRWIFELPAGPHALVERRAQWHFEGPVYGAQVGGRPQDAATRRAEAEAAARYVAVLDDTVFSLCPSGSGPNSIRLWESLALGCIPVLLSDRLRLPGEASDWDGAVVRVAEEREAVRELPRRLATLTASPDRLEAMRQAGRTARAKSDLQFIIKTLTTQISMIAAGRTVSRPPWDGCAGQGGGAHGGIG